MLGKKIGKSNKTRTIDSLMTTILEILYGHNNLKNYKKESIKFYNGESNNLTGIYKSLSKIKLEKDVGSLIGVLDLYNSDEYLRSEISDNSYIENFPKFLLPTRISTSK